MSEHFWNGILTSRYTAPINKHLAAQSAEGGVWETRREFPFPFLASTAWQLASRFLCGSRRNSRSTPCAMLSPVFKRQGIRYAVLYETVCESLFFGLLGNPKGVLFDSPRQPWGRPDHPACEALLLKMQFLFREGPSACGASLETFAFLKGFLHNGTADKGHITNAFLGW